MWFHFLLYLDYLQKFFFKIWSNKCIIFLVYDGYVYKSYIFYNTLYKVLWLFFYNVGLHISRRTQNKTSGYRKTVCRYEDIGSWALAGQQHLQGMFSWHCILFLATLYCSLGNIILYCSPWPSNAFIRTYCADQWVAGFSCCASLKKHLLPLLE